MGDLKMREALDQIKALTEIPFAHTAGDHELIYQIATEALAQQSAEMVKCACGDEYAVGSYGHGFFDVAGHCPNCQPAAGLELTDEGLDLLKMILPFIATQAIGCHGEKCREVWCHSCNGEFDAELAAEKGAALAFRLSKLIAAHEAKKNGGGV